MATKNVHHNIVYWCEYILVVEVTTYSNIDKPDTHIVFGGDADTTEKECEAYIAGYNANKWRTTT
tara:strand:+ start:1081 stop:1275 length:195 start_codon:yes stop_codon:yes gene_type:complete